MKNIQLPDDVYQRASKLAEQDHISANKPAAVLVSEGIGAWSRLQDRAARGSVVDVLVIDVLVMGTNPASPLKIATRDIASDMTFSNDVHLRAAIMVSPAGL